MDSLLLYGIYNAFCVLKYISFRESIAGHITKTRNATNVFNLPVIGVIIVFERIRLERLDISESVKINVY